MTDCERREARREYHRRWRQAHPDNVRAAQVRFWARQAERMKQNTTTATDAGKTAPVAAEQED